MLSHILPSNQSYRTLIFFFLLVSLYLKQYKRIINTLRNLRILTVNTT